MCCARVAGSDACVLVYDVTNKKSFKKIDAWRKEFLKKVNPADPDQFPFVVMGTWRARAVPCCAAVACCTTVVALCSAKAPTCPTHEALGRSKCCLQLSLPVAVLRRECRHLTSRALSHPCREQD